MTVAVQSLEGWLPPWAGQSEEKPHFHDTWPGAVCVHAHMCVPCMFMCVHVGAKVMWGDEPSPSLSAVPGGVYLIYCGILVF